jgi:Rps23 Pro-64 3,4-dihydroxylase Tpa1-like proline 4-hydroxylase
MLGLQPGLVHQSGDASARPQAITAPFVTVDGFLPQAEALRLRGEIDAHFAEPHKHAPERHQVWNYWYVPQLYTYLRTSPEKVIAAPLVRRFYEALSVFAREVVGLGHVTWPNLSLYVDGCEQQLHNDSANGRLGYVYSLTRDSRKTIGGETILLKEGDGFRANLERAAAGWGLYDLIEPSFNRLALFDDRMPHGVRRVDGSMDPLEGRFVLHGHISESGPFSGGPIDATEIGETVAAALAPLHAELQASPGAPHGPLTLRLTIAASGRVEQLQTMLNRVARPDGLPVEPAVEQALAIVRGLRWPQAASPTEAVVPILFGGPLPWMRASGA